MATMEQCWNDTDREKLNNSENTCPSVSMFTNLTWNGAGNLGLPSESAETAWNEYLNREQQLKIILKLSFYDT
jgi:hypothetical protein